MDHSSIVRVLFVGGSPQLFSLHQKQLERKGCECEFAECEGSACEMLGQRQFDFVLCLHASRGTRGTSLAVLLSGSPTTLFYALRVEVGFWWVPILRLGEECFGSPSLRPSEFANELDDVLDEIRVVCVRTAPSVAASYCADAVPGKSSGNEIPVASSKITSTF
jgi:hypothetical protein